MGSKEIPKEGGNSIGDCVGELPRGEGEPCDACGTPMKPLGHCKYWCLACGFQRTCNDVI